MWFLGCDRMTFGGKKGYQYHITPSKINMEPKNEGLEDDFPFQTGDFQVPCYFSGVYGSSIPKGSILHLS